MLEGSQTSSRNVKLIIEFTQQIVDIHNVMLEYNIVLIIHVYNMNSD